MAEILALFETLVYGLTPSKEIGVRAELLSEVEALEGKAKRKEVRLYFTAKDERPYLDLLIYSPKDAKSSPAFVGLNFHGNHSVTVDGDVIL
ncbi:acetylxylan esterase, partial [bacterium]|nr:acetylxylan esterase [bacterium]